MKENNLDSIIEKILTKLNVTKIISLGDSHSNFYENLNNIEVRCIGPALAYNINKYDSKNGTKTQIVSILNETDSSNTAFILTFGEIDVRVHIVKRTQVENISLEESSIRVAKKYIEMIQYMVEKGYKVIINGLHGTGVSLAENTMFPYNGSIQDRNFATVTFNSYLEDFCNENKIPFMSLSDMVINKDTNKTRFKHMDDGCHLNSTPEIQEIALSRFLSQVEKFQ